MAGKLHNQKRKKLRKSLVLVPELAGMLLRRSVYLVQIARIMSVTHSPTTLSDSQSQARGSSDIYLQSMIAHHTRYKP